MISQQTSQKKNFVIFKLDLTRKKLASNTEKLDTIERDLKHKLH